MGLGKTVQTLAAIQQDRREGAEEPTLLVCPTSVINNWRKEAARFTPDLPLMVHHGPGRKRDAEFVASARQHAIVAAQLRGDGAGRGVHRRGAVAGHRAGRGAEHQEPGHPAGPGRPVAGRRVPDCPDRHARGEPRGRPVVSDAVPEPGPTGTEGEFKRNYFVPIQAERDEGAPSGCSAPPALHPAEAQDRPDRNQRPAREGGDQGVLYPDPEQATLYEAVLREAEQALEEAEGIERRGAILGTLTRLKQVCNHPRQLLGDNSAIAGRSGKLARLQDMLEEIIAVGDRALVFSQFAEMGAILQRHIQDTFGKGRCSCTAGSPGVSGTAWWSGSRTPGTGRRCSSCRCGLAAPA